MGSSVLRGNSSSDTQLQGLTAFHDLLHCFKASTTSRHLYIICQVLLAHHTFYVMLLKKILRRFHLVDTDLLLVTLIIQPLIIISIVSGQFHFSGAGVFLIIAKSSAPVHQKLQVFSLKYQQTYAIASFRNFFLKPHKSGIPNNSFSAFLSSKILKDSPIKF